MGTKLSDYMVKNLKSCNGLEGYAFSGQIAKNGVKVAEFINSGDGGSTAVDFVSKDRREEFKVAVEEAGFTGAEPIETAISVMADAAEGVKGIKQKIKKHVVVHAFTAPAGEVCTLKLAYPSDDGERDRFRKAMSSKFIKGYTVLNELSEDALWDLWLGWQVGNYQQMLAA
jgi:hypothetical protein